MGNIITIETPRVRLRDCKPGDRVWYPAWEQTVTVVGVAEWGKRPCAYYTEVDRGNDTFPLGSSAMVYRVKEGK